MAGVLTIHYGLMGSGKTLFAMNDVVLPAVREHRPFFTNITGINLSAISWLTGVHPTMIKYYPVQNIQDVIGYFDNNEISHDGVFVLDEMKDFIDNEKAVSWLESRINITRKMGVDFLFIAQQAKKQYIHPDLLGLADTCKYFAHRKQKGDKEHVDMYDIQGGDPKVVNKVPLVYDGLTTRKKDKRVYLTYSTSDSKFYQGKEDDSYKGLMWWQTRKWKFRFAIIAIFVLFVGIAVFLIWGIVNFASTDLGSLSSVGTEQTKVGENEKTASNIPASMPDTIPCFAYLVCDSFDCRTDKGMYPRNLYNDDSGVLCVDGICQRKCERVDHLSNGGGLLSVGKQIFAK